jgi:hypothetical protein
VPRAAEYGTGKPSANVTQLSTAAAPAGVWIRLDSPEWFAWRDYRVGKPFPLDQKGGWTAPRRTGRPGTCTGGLRHEPCVFSMLAWSAAQ